MADNPVIEQAAYFIAVATADGQTSFAFNFRADTADQVAAYKGTVSPATSLGVTPGFSVSGLGNNAGGSITLNSGDDIAEDDQIIIVRETPIDRLADYQTSGDFRAVTVNAELDRATMVDQELARDLARSVKVPFGSVGGTMEAGDVDHIATHDGAGGLKDSGVDIGDITAAVGNAALVQAALDTLARTLRLSVGETADDLPAPASRVSKILGFDGAGAVTVSAIEFRVNGSALEYRIGAGAWLATGFDVDALTGGQIQLRESAGVLQWKRADEVDWTDLYTVNGHVHDDAYRRGYVTDSAVTSEWSPGRLAYFVDLNNKPFMAAREDGAIEMIDADPVAAMIEAVRPMPGPSDNVALRLVDAAGKVFGELLGDGRIRLRLDEAAVRVAVDSVLASGISFSALGSADGQLALSFDESGKPNTTARKFGGQTGVSGSTVFLRRSSGQSVNLATFSGVAIIAHQAIDDERAWIVVDRPNMYSQTGLIYDIHGNTPMLAGPVVMGVQVYGQSGAASHQAAQLPLISPSVFPGAMKMLGTTRNVQDVRTGLNSTNVSDQLTAAEPARLVPLAERVGVYAQAGQSFATGINDIVQGIAKLVCDQPLAMWADQKGVGSQPFSTIGNGSALGNSLETAIASAVNLFGARGHALFVNMLLDHGEAANGSQYFSQLQALKTWPVDEIKSITGQVRTPLVGHAPNCSYTGAGMIFSSSQATKMLRYSQTQNPHWFRIISTQYQYFARAAGLQSCTEDLIHKNRLGVLKLAQMFAHMLVDEVLLGKTWKYPYVDEIEHTGNTTIIHFADLDGSLEDYTVANGDRPAEWLDNHADKNFTVRGTTQNVLTSVTITGAAEVTCVSQAGTGWLATGNQLRLGNKTHAVGNLQINTVPTIAFADNGWERECLYEPGTYLRKALTPVLILFDQNATTAVTYAEHYGS